MTSQLFDRSVILCAAVLAVLSGAQALGPFDIETKMAASDAATHDEFVQSVAISGDTAIVGAKSNEDFGSRPGAAYILSPD